MTEKLTWSILLFVTIFLFSFQPTPPKAPEISAAYMESVVQTLGGDEYEGRRPFTQGEARATAYLEGQLKELGVEPGNGESYFQDRR